MSAPHSSNDNPPVAEYAQASQGGFADKPSEHQNFTGKTTSGSCWFPCLLLAGLFLLVIVGGSYTLFRFLAPDIEVVSEEEAAARLAQKYDSIQSAFSGDAVSNDQADQELQEFNKFFKTVAEVSDYTLNSKLKKIVDYDRYAEVVRKEPALGPVAYFGNSFVSALLRQRIIGPTPFSEIQIYRIDHLTSDERLIYAQITGEYGDDMPYLFWVKKHQSGWKLYDWEHVRYGIRDSEETAVVLGDNNPRTSQDYDTYVTLYEEYSQDSGIEDFQKEQLRIRKILKRSELLSFHERLEAPYLFDIAHRYWFNDDNDLALELLDRVKDVKRVPGKLYLLGLILFEQGKYEDSLAALSRYHQQVGYDWESLNYVADNYQQLGQVENELNTRWMTVRDINDTGYESLNRMIALQGDAAVEEIFTDPFLAKLLKDRMADLANNLSGYPIFESELAAIVEHFKAGDPESKQFYKASSALNFMLGNFDEGLKQLELGMVDDDRYELLSRAAEMGKLVEVVKKSPDRMKDYDNVSFMYYDDGSVTEAQFEEIVNLILAEHPQSAAQNLAAGHISFDKGDYKNAIVFLTRALEPTDGKPLEEYEIERVESLLLSSHFKLSQLDDALKHADGNDDLMVEFADLILADQAESEEHEPMLAKILDNLRGWQKLRLKGRMALAAENFAEAADSFADALNEILDDEANYWTGRGEMMSLMKACQGQGEVLNAFQLCHHPNMFGILASEFSQDGDWQRATQLIDDAEGMIMNAPDQWGQKQRQRLSAEILKLKIDVSWHQNEYDKVLQYFEEYQDSVDREEIPIESNAIEWAVRSAIRSKQPELAERLVEGKGDDHRWRAAVALVALLKRDFEKYQEVNDYLYGDQSNFHLTATEIGLSAAEMRQAGDDIQSLIQYSHPNLESIKIGSVSRAPVTTESLKGWIRELDLELFQLPELTSANEERDSTSTWLMRGSDLRIVIQTQEASWTTENVSENIENVVRTAKYLLSIDCMGEDRAKARRFASELANRFAADDSVVLQMQYQNGLWEDCKGDLGKLARGEIFRSQLLSNLTLNVRIRSEDDEFDSEEYYSFSSAKKRASDRLKFGRVAKRFVKLVPMSTDSSGDTQSDLAPQADGQAKLRVHCRLTLASAVEQLPVDVDLVIRDSIYSIEYQGILRQSSILHPHFRAGDRVSVPRYSVGKWELRDAEGNVVEQGENER